MINQKRNEMINYRSIFKWFAIFVAVTPVVLLIANEFTGVMQNWFVSANQNKVMGITAAFLNVIGYPLAYKAIQQTVRE